MKAVEILQGSKLFQGWKEAELAGLGQKSEMKDLSVGEGLFVQGEESDSFYIVGRGTVSIQRMASGEDQDVTKVGPGSVLGEMGMLVAPGSSPEPRSAGASAFESTVVLRIPYAALDALIEATPHLGVLFYKNLGMTLASRIRRTTEDLAGLRALRLRHT